MNPCLLCWQVNLLPRSHQGSPLFVLCMFFFFLAVLLQVWSLGQKHHVGVWKTCTFSGPLPRFLSPGRQPSMFYRALQVVRCMLGFENAWSVSVPVSCVMKACLPPAVSRFTGPPGSSHPIPQRWVFTALEPPASTTRVQNPLPAPPHSTGTKNSAAMTGGFSRDEQTGPLPGA